MSQYSVHPSLTFTATSCSTITSSESGRASGRLCQPFGRDSLRGLNPWYPLSPIVGGLIWCVATWKATGIVRLYCAVFERIASHDVRGPSQYLFVVVAVHRSLSWLARTRPRIHRNSCDPFKSRGRWFGMWGIPGCRVQASAEGVESGLINSPELDRDLICRDQHRHVIKRNARQRTGEVDGPCTLLDQLQCIFTL
jgi:hypothetical protein